MKLTGEDIFKLVAEGMSLRTIAQDTNSGRRSLTKKLHDYCEATGQEKPYTPTSEQKGYRRSGKKQSRARKAAPKPAPVPIEIPSKVQLKHEGKRRYVITSAHNNTPIHEGFFNSLLAYCKAKNAQLCVIPLLYRNPSLFVSAQQAVEWPDQIIPYSLHNDIEINDNWMIAGRLHIQATAARPLQGMQGYSKNRSAIIGHARIAWETRPTPPGSPAICQITTGSISLPQYSDTKLGQLSEFHHAQGALLIETDGERTFVRHLRPGGWDGAFYDFDDYYSPTNHAFNLSSLGASSIDAVVFGDLHQWFSPEQNLILDFCRRYKPLQTFLHDPIDAFSISPHHEHDPLMRAAKSSLGLNNLEAEVKSLIKFHEDLAKALDKGEIVYVASNHTDQIMRWMKGRNWQQMDKNTSIHRFILNQYMDAMENTQQAEMYVRTGELPSVLELLMRKYGATLENTRFPSINDSIQVHGVECGQHGHIGTNGTKGTPASFRNAQTKITIGHMHTPGIYDGVHVVGTSSALKMNYNNGLSSWMNVHEMIYSNGKRVLFNTVNGQYRLED